MPLASVSSTYTDLAEVDLHPDDRDEGVARVGALSCSGSSRSPRGAHLREARAPRPDRAPAREPRAPLVRPPRDPLHAAGRLPLHLHPRLPDRERARARALHRRLVRLRRPRGQGLLRPRREAPALDAAARRRHDVRRAGHALADLRPTGTSPKCGSASVTAPRGVHPSERYRRPGVRPMLRAWWLPQPHALAPRLSPWDEEVEYLIETGSEPAPLGADRRAESADVAARRARDRRRAGAGHRPGAGRARAGRCTRTAEAAERRPERPSAQKVLSGRRRRRTAPGSRCASPCSCRRRRSRAPRRCPGRRSGRRGSW